jgi:hypothetical protein
MACNYKGKWYLRSECKKNTDTNEPIGNRTITKTQKDSSKFKNEFELSFYLNRSILL